MTRKPDLTGPEPPAPPPTAPAHSMPSGPELREKLAKFYGRFTDELSVQQAAREQLAMRRTGATPKPSLSPVQCPVDFAGLVILAPYLPVFLRNLDLVGSVGAISGENLATGVATLVYLATGRSATPGDNLAFPCRLLGSEEDIITLPALPARNKDEADRLLGSVIAHWPAAQSLKLAGLRDAMLQRPGKLTRVADSDQLQVAPHAIDVLLPSLPWGFGAICHFWMKRPIVVDWS